MNEIFKNINFCTIDYCNRSCYWCPNVHDQRKTKELMPINIVNCLLNQLKEINFTGIVSPFGNNECLEDNRIFDIIDLIKTTLPNNTILIHTNGDKLFDCDIYNKFCESKLDHVIINCYDGIKRYHELHELFGLKPEDAFNYGNYIKFNKHIEIRLTDRPLPHFWNRAGNVDIKPSFKDRYCFIPFQWCTVNHKGDVYLCCSDWNYEMIFGNITKQNILDIWNCEEYKKYRKYHLMEKGKELPVCNKCNRIF